MLIGKHSYNTIRKTPFLKCIHIIHMYSFHSRNINTPLIYTFTLKKKILYSDKKILYSDKKILYSDSFAFLFFVLVCCRQQDH
jgi:hypothetical protein